MLIYYVNNTDGRIKLNKLDSIIISFIIYWRINSSREECSHDRRINIEDKQIKTNATNKHNEEFCFKLRNILNFIL